MTPKVFVSHPSDKLAPYYGERNRLLLDGAGRLLCWGEHDLGPRLGRNCIRLPHSSHCLLVPLLMNCKWNDLCRLDAKLRLPPELLLNTGAILILGQGKQLDEGLLILAA